MHSTARNVDDIRNLTVSEHEFLLFLGVSKMLMASQTILIFFCSANLCFVYTTLKYDVRKSSAVPDMPLQI